MHRAAEPDPAGGSALVADWAEAWARRFQARVERQTVEPGKDNVIVTLDFEGDGPCLLFNTHMDVNNPAGQIWSQPPFEPAVRDGRVYGLGACDAKGSLAAMLTAMERLAQRSEGLRGKLVLTAVMGEEAGGIGSLHLVRQGIQADGAVVGEPTQLEAAIAHKGTYMRKIRFRGRAAHSGSPHLGINAIVHAARFCLEYDRLNESLAQSPHPQLGPANAAVTIVHGGTRQNTIPESAELIADRRLIPGETHQDADRELERILRRMKEDIPQLQVDPIEVVVATIPSQTDESERIVKVALAALEQATGSAKKAQGFSAGCDMSKLVTIAGIPTVILGPGSLAEAHAPDEFVEIAQLEQAVDIYERIAREFLKG
ncbi:M20 family metallopeptidase [Gordoniibacillus kamchatkensis]|uniref:M20 family metallopeptidase n=1 Tax=Gordoniibacillus kamchatkensis TaxID=1590651 RepID=UPI000698D062|nr:M20 family metallopeptidase [Paenibacillus sp. VKM B-2647]